MEGATGVGVGAADVELGAALCAGAVGCGGRRSAGSATTGSARPEADTGVEGSTTVVGSAGVAVPPAIALRIANAAPNTSTTISAAIATRPREVAVTYGTRSSGGARSSTALGHSQGTGRLEPGFRQRWILVKLAWPIRYSM